MRGVAKDLAKKTHADLRKNPAAHDHRGGCHWSYLHATLPDGTLPPELLKITEKQFEDAFVEAFEHLLGRNHYRPFDPETVKELKDGKWLPDDVKADKPLVITLGEGVEYGKKYLPRWKAMREEERKAAPKK